MILISGHCNIDGSEEADGLKREESVLTMSTPEYAVDITSAGRRRQIKNT